MYLSQKIEFQPKKRFFQRDFVGKMLGGFTKKEKAFSK
jgi:hypothetical protein